MALLHAVPIFLLSGIVAGGSNNATTPGSKHGWVSQPDGRGTTDILLSSLFTVFLCTWVSLHLNVPAVHENYWAQFRRKCRWMIQAIMAPEFVIGFATGQKVEAKRSVLKFEAFKASKSDEHPVWTIRHGFYANMGGFHLKTAGATRTFPVNANQIYYLVDKHYIKYPTLTGKEVWDKSKADGFQKTFTCMQTGWYIVQCLGRVSQKLAITTLELTTLSYVFCTLFMYIQWANKPLDVESPTILVSEATIEQILIEAGEEASKLYHLTPLDFIDDQSPSWLIDVQPHLRFRRGPPERPLPRFTNDRLPVIGASADAILLFIVSMTYCSLHFVAWNFEFPTQIEKILWRASAITIVVTAKIFWLCETYQDGVRLGRWERWYKRMFPDRAEKAIRFRSTREEKKKPMFIPVWEVVIMIPVTFFYSLARSYIVIEIFLGQRSLPSSAFDTVDWSHYLPHF